MVYSKYRAGSLCQFMAQRGTVLFPVTLNIFGNSWNAQEVLLQLFPCRTFSILICGYRHPHIQVKVTAHKISFFSDFCLTQLLKWLSFASNRWNVYKGKMSWRFLASIPTPIGDTTLTVPHAHHACSTEEGWTHLCVWKIPPPNEGRGGSSVCKVLVWK